MTDLMQFVAALGDFIAALAAYVASLARALLPWLPGGLWCAWWLWCVNWKHAWPVLARGGWLVAALVTLVSALAWSAIFPGSRRWLGVPVANFWWQLACCTSLALVALFCGWLQGRWNLTPAEVSFDPAPHHDGHGHGPIHGGPHGLAHGGHATAAHGGHH